MAINNRQLISAENQEFHFWNSLLPELKLVVLSNLTISELQMFALTTSASNDLYAKKIIPEIRRGQFCSFLAIYQLRQTRDHILKIDTLDLDTSPESKPEELQRVAALRRAYDKLSKYLSEHLPDVDEKYAFTNWLASNEIQAINALTFWQLALYKFLLNLGVTLHRSEREKAIVNPMNLGIIKRVTKSFSPADPAKRIPYLFTAYQNPPQILQDENQLLEACKELAAELERLDLKRLHIVFFEQMIFKKYPSNRPSLVANYREAARQRMENMLAQSQGRENAIKTSIVNRFLINFELYDRKAARILISMIKEMNEGESETFLNIDVIDYYAYIKIRIEIRYFRDQSDKSNQFINLLAGTPQNITLSLINIIRILNISWQSFPYTYLNEALTIVYRQFLQSPPDKIHPALFKAALIYLLGSSRENNSKDVAPFFSMMEALSQQPEQANAIINLLVSCSYQKIKFCFEHLPYLNRHSLFLFKLFIALIQNKPSERTSPCYLTPLGGFSSAAIEDYMGIITILTNTKNNEFLKYWDNTLYQFIENLLFCGDHHGPSNAKIKFNIAIKVLHPDSVFWKLPKHMIKELIKDAKTIAWGIDKWELFSVLTSHQDIPDRMQRLGPNALLLSDVLLKRTTTSHISCFILLTFILPNRLFEESLALIRNTLDPNVKMNKPTRLAILRKDLLGFLGRDNIKDFLYSLTCLYIGKKKDKYALYSPNRPLDEFIRKRDEMATVLSEKISRGPKRTLSTALQCDEALGASPAKRPRITPGLFGNPQQPIPQQPAVDAMDLDEALPPNQGPNM